MGMHRGCVWSPCEDSNGGPIGPVLALLVLLALMLLLHSLLGLHSLRLWLNRRKEFATDARLRKLCDVWTAGSL